MREVLTEFGGALAGFGMIRRSRRYRIEAAIAHVMFDHCGLFLAITVRIHRAIFRDWDQHSSKYAHASDKRCHRL